ncbi:TolC family protein [Diaphorobacter sp. HDW4B]|uniref:TolC family protein n=1 Tax=Diaphorobacter sp. HDW4B TaxID=2714925 RepID=UPI001F0E9395|nr:TolC family protein [Diaphorobacter sp. HDW4B]
MTELTLAALLVCGLTTLSSAMAQTANGSAPVTAAAQMAPAASAMPQQPVTLEEYLRMVVRNRPSLAADRMEAGLARADTRTASAFPNPSVSAYGKPGEHGIGIDQPIPIFGQRGARIETAKKGELAADAHVELAVNAVLNDAAQAFNDLLVAQKRVEVWQDAQKALDKAAYIVRGQIDAGARSRYDGARLTLQQAQLVMQLNKANAALKAASTRAAQVAALPLWPARAEGSIQTLNQQQMPEFDTLWNQAASRLPALRSAQAEMEQARSKIDLAKREALPTPSIGAMRVKSRNDGSYTQWGVSMEIPLFDRHQGAIDRAKMEAEQAELRWQAANQDAQAGLYGAMQQWQLKRDSVRAYEKDGLAQIEPLKQMANDAYKLGQGGILELIDALSSINDHRLEYLDLVKDYLDAEWQVRLASGNVPVSE